MRAPWRLLITLCLALALPLQGLAAASGLWCPQRGFHGTDVSVAAETSAHAGHTRHAGHAAHTALPAPSAKASVGTPPHASPLAPSLLHATGELSPTGPVATGNAADDVATHGGAALNTVACSLCATCGLGLTLVSADLRVPVDATSQRLTSRDLPAPARADLPGPERPPRITLT